MILRNFGNLLGNWSKTGQKFKIPFETIDEHDYLTYDINKVIKRWENDFSNLFQITLNMMKHFLKLLKVV